MENTTVEFDKYLKKIDLIDYYITKNINELIEDKESYDFIVKNPFLFSVTNKSNKNSLIILLENRKYDIVLNLIENNNDLLKIKNYNENTLFNILLRYNNFYDLIINIIKTYKYSLVMYLLITENDDGETFINLIIKLLNEYGSDNNDLIEYKKVIDIFKQIVNLDREKNLLLITTLCKEINSDDMLYDILSKILIKKINIYSDEYLLNAVDYLLLNNNIKSLDFLMKNVNKVKFCSFENLFVTK